LVELILTATVVRLVPSIENVILTEVWQEHRKIQREFFYQQFFNLRIPFFFISCEVVKVQKVILFVEETMVLQLKLLPIGLRTKIFILFQQFYYGHKEIIIQ
jgi:hypothetical protein